MIQKFETFAPLFPGFYSTPFEYSGEEQDIEDYNEANGTDKDWDDFNFDYSDYHNRVSKAFVNRLETELNQFLQVKIEFQQLISPKEYNFTNDSINISVEMDLGQLIGLIKERQADAAKYFEDKYTSRSGFISFHSSDINDWLNEQYILKEPAHRVGALLDCLCSIEIDTDDIYYWCDSEYYIDFSPKEDQPA